MTFQAIRCDRDESLFQQARCVVLPQSGSRDPESICPRRESDAAWVVLSGGVPVGRALAQTMPTRSGTGNVGLFECIPDPDAAGALLIAVETYLRGLGCRRVVGPMDADTWHAYRTADPSSQPPFPLDRDTPPWYGDLFASCGYQVCDRYLSTFIPREHLEWPRLESGLARCARSGIVVEGIRTQDWDGELARLHDLSVRAFASNRWASPLDLDSFKALHEPFRGRIPSRSILMARCPDTDLLLAFLFSVPEPVGDTSRRLVVKTVATAPDPRARGLGALLTEMAHRDAHRAGFFGVVHALMHESNPSTRIKATHGQILRTYSLWAKEIP